MKRVLNVLAITVLLAALGAVTAYVGMEFVFTREGVVVPDLVGKDLVAALEAANKLGLSLKIVERAFHTSASANQVISQEPKPGGWLKAEGVVRVVVSKGIGEVVVPNVAGLPWREAKATLDRYGLRLGEGTRVHTEHVPRDTVIAQTPPGEAKSMKGGTVALLVSDGTWPVDYVMPDLRGQPQYAANEMVTSMGLRVEKVLYAERPDSRAGAVLEQRPAVGHRVVAGQGVELVLAKRETTPTSQVGTFTLFQHRIPEGSAPRRIQIVIANEEESRQVFDQVREPGAEVRLLVKVKGDTIAKVYHDGVLVEEKRLQ
ncbi:MAG: PASTA domain-containing protein [Nitrospinae bacterium]|nr:PASTA domain-containing protein [Nitrospinota bacterium]